MGLAAWYDRPVVCLDLETTGLGKYGDDSIVQIGLVAVDPAGRRVGRELVTLVKPTTPMGAQAQRVHGISYERAMDEGRPVSDVMEEAADMLETAYGRGFPLVIHNALFDWPFMLTSFQATGVPNPAARILDTYLLASVARRHSAAGLAKLVARYEVGVQAGVHDAGHDAQLCGALLFALIEKHDWLKRESLQTYYADQVKWNQQYPHRGTHPHELWPGGFWSENQVARQLEFVTDWGSNKRHEKKPEGFTPPDPSDCGPPDGE